MIQDPLLDFTFLYELDHYRNRTTYARITSLTSDGYPVERIEGVVTAGSVTIDGDSAVRRICSLTLTSEKLNINNIYWALTTRVKIEIGIENNLYHYKYYPDIIWFPQGVFVLTDFKTSAQVNNYTISLSGKDKMCLLNGDVGGVFNAETHLDEERIETEDGEWVLEKRSIAYVIREMIHHYGQEPFHNIVIKDIDNLSLKILRNNAATFFLVQEVKSDNIVDIASDDSKILLEPTHKFYYQEYPAVIVSFNSLLDGFEFLSQVDEDDNGLIPYRKEPSKIYYKNEKGENVYCHVIKIEPGEDIGYELTETYYPEELIAGINETVVSILDKIVKTFGAFEYFYNLDGQFVFQEKKTYVNTAWNNIYKTYSDNNEVWIAPNQVSSQVKYAFEGSKITSAYQNAPQLGNIKNDFTVWGKYHFPSGLDTPIHMRYAIDRKPNYYWSFTGKGFISEDFYNYTIKDNYQFEEGDSSIMLNGEEYKIVDWREIIYQMAKDYYQHNHDDDFERMIQLNNAKTFYQKDNTPQAFRDYEKGRTGYEQYYHDIEGFWRLLYAPKDEVDEFDKSINESTLFYIDKDNFYEDGTYIGPWNKNINLNPHSLLFWFDFFDADSLGLGQFSVPAVGARPKNENNDTIRALIYKDVPDVVFIEQDIYDDYDATGRLLSGYNYIMINEGLSQYIDEGKISISTRSITAQERIDDLLYNYAYCNETITITSVPIYYLEPNTIISARDEERMVHGYYIINKITLPLDYKGTMSITAIKVPERIY